MNNRTELFKELLVFLLIITSLVAFSGELISNSTTTTNQIKINMEKR